MSIYLFSTLNDVMVEERCHSHTLSALITSSLHARTNVDSTIAQQRAIVYCIMHFTPYHRFVN